MFHTHTHLSGPFSDEQVSTQLKKKSNAFRRSGALDIIVFRFSASLAPEYFSSRSSPISGTALIVNVPNFPVFRFGQGCGVAT
jgi:hypothetical protein